MAVPAPPADVLVFGEYELDARRFELRRAGEVVHTEPKAFDLLLHLARNRERVVTKEELLDELWPGAASDAVIARYVADARKAVNDHASSQRVIKTLHGRGYRFVADVTSSALQDAGESRDPFVGRTDALASLDAALRDALSGRPRLVVLVGEPGIGKTRTAAELSRRARDRGAMTLHGRCHEGEGAPPFWPWVQVLRSIVSSFGPDRLRAALGARARDLAPLVPALGGEASDAFPELSPEQARFRQFDATAELLRHVAGERPVVIVLDDLHWADKASLLLMRFLTGDLSDARVLVVGTYRDVELGRRHPLAEILGDLAREAAFTRVTLRGLTGEDVRDYLARLHEGRAGEDVAEAVHRMTDGNPFFLGEVARLLAAEQQSGALAVGALALPEGVREAIGRRLNALSRDTNDVLAVASVLGRSFAVPILERVVELPAEKTLAALDEALAARVLVSGDGLELSFVHALVRETLYDELSIVQKVTLHRRAAEVLAAAHQADPGPHLAEVAHHYFQAAPSGRGGEAVDYCERAAERALVLLSYEEAAQHFSRALEALGISAPDDSERRARLLLALGNAQVSSGERDGARDTFRRAATVARAMGRADLLARAALGLGGPFDYFGTPADAELGALLEEARTALITFEAGEHRGLRAGIIGRLASTPPYSESMSTRDELSREAVDLARSSGEIAMLSRALGARYWALLGPDHVHDRLEIGAELIALTGSTGDLNHAVLGHEFRFGSLVALGDVVRADQEVAELDRMASELRRPVDQWLVTWFRASRALSDGRFDDASVLIEKARAHGERAQHPGARVVFAGQSLWLAHERGHTDVFEEGLQAFEDGYPWAARVGRITALFAHTEGGRLDQARRALDAVASGGLRTIPRDEHWSLLMCLLATSCATLADVDRSAIVYDLLRPFAERMAVHDLLRVHLGSVALYLGMLAGTLGDDDRAEEHFQSSLAINRRIGSRPYVARAELQYGKWLRRSDPRAAARHLAAAAREATALGMAGVAAMARSAAAG